MLLVPACWGSCPAVSINLPDGILYTSSSVMCSGALMLEPVTAAAAVCLCVLHSAGLLRVRVALPT